MRARRANPAHPVSSRGGEIHPMRASSDQRCTNALSIILEEKGSGWAQIYVRKGRKIARGENRGGGEHLLSTGFVHWRLMMAREQSDG